MHGEKRNRYKRCRLINLQLLWPLLWHLAAIVIYALLSIQRSGSLFFNAMNFLVYVL